MMTPVEALHWVKSPNASKMSPFLKMHLTKAMNQYSSSGTHRYHGSIKRTIEMIGNEEIAVVEKAILQDKGAQQDKSESKHICTILLQHNRLLWLECLVCILCRWP